MFTIEEVAKHNTVSNCWIIIEGKVYDITKYLDDHPGGADIILGFAGLDATDMFESIGHSNDALQKLSEFYIGDLN